MHILDESANFTAPGSDLDSFPLLTLPPHIVSREGFLKDLYKRTISGQKDTVEFRFLVNVICCDIQANERLASHGYTGDKANRLP